MIIPPLSAQLKFGPKASIQTFAPMYSDAILPSEFSVVPQLGFSVGAVIDYEITKRVSFYTELSYSKRGKKITGGINDMFKHVAKYNYIDMPVMLRVNFKGSTKKNDFMWYLSAGGMLSYWVSGKGTINSFELDELNLAAIDYKISFKSIDESEPNLDNKLYLAESNKIQAGLTFESGLYIPFKKRQHIMVSLRYTYRQSWLAGDYNVDMGLGEYFEDFRTLEHVLSLNTAWLFEWDLGQGKKGRSTIKARPRR
jgi:hypothetical protein